MKRPRRETTKRFFGPGGSVRGAGAQKAAQEQLFEVPDELDPDEPTSSFGIGELDRDIHRMTLETSSNVYAQRRATW